MRSCIFTFFVLDATSVQNSDSDTLVLATCFESIVSETFPKYLLTFRKHGNILQTMFSETCFHVWTGLF